MFVSLPFYLSVCLYVTLSVRTDNRLPLDWFSWIWYLRIFRKSVENPQVSFKSDKNNVHFTWRLMYIYETISLNYSIFQTAVVVKIAKYLIFTEFFPTAFRLWDNVGKYGKATEATDDNIIRRMCLSCCIPKATTTYLEYVILTAFAQQRWLSESPSTLCYTCIAWLFAYVIAWTANPLNLLLTTNRSIANPLVAPFLIFANYHPQWPSSRSK